MARGTQREGAFRDLVRRGGTGVSRAGCLLLLGAPVAGIGVLLIVASHFVFPDAPTAVAQRVVGTALAVIGLLTFFARLRRDRAAAGPRVELAIAARNALHPGCSALLRIRVSGPCTFERLTVTTVCERHHKGAAVPTLDGPGATADLVETVAEQLVFEAPATTVARGRLFEREVPLTISSLGRPTGPVLPSGTIAWHLRADVDSGRVTDRFDIVVEKTGEEGQPAPASSRAGEAARTEGTDAGVGTESVLAGLGCALMPLLFVLAGSGFLYLYFSGAQTRRGNPVVGLVYGTVCVLVGLIGLLAAFTGRKGRRRRFSRRHPRRLPK